MQLLRQSSEEHRGSRQPGRVYRGSRKRLARLRWHENTPLRVWILVAVVLLMFVGAFLWLFFARERGI